MNGYREYRVGRRRVLTATTRCSSGEGAPFVFCLPAIFLPFDCLMKRLQTALIRGGKGRAGAGRCKTTRCSEDLDDHAARSGGHKQEFVRRRKRLVLVISPVIAVVITRAPWLIDWGISESLPDALTLVLVLAFTTAWFHLLTWWCPACGWYPEELFPLLLEVRVALR